MNLYQFFKHLNKISEELSVKDISNKYTGVTFNRHTKQIVGTMAEIKEFQKSSDSKLFESTGWTYVKTGKPQKISSDFEGVKYNPLKREIVASEKIMQEYVKTRECQQLINNGWCTIITEQNGDNEMIEFLDSKRLVLLPESIAKYLDNREDGETNVESLLNLQVACDGVGNTHLSVRQEIQDYGSIPYKYRMRILVKFKQGYGYTSYERQQIEELHDLSTADMNELVEKIRKWAYNRGLTKADPAKQMLKVIEELGEVGAAMARGDLNELMDGIGDVTVTLIILAAQHELDFENCLEVAYSEIKDRKGELVGGVFVKEEDLNNA